MQTREQIETEFRAELESLLKKWGATIEVEDHYSGYAECGRDMRMTVYIPGIYDLDADEKVRDYCEIDLGKEQP